MDPYLLSSPSHKRTKRRGGEWRGREKRKGSWERKRSKDLRPTASRISLPILGEGEGEMGEEGRWRRGKRRKGRKRRGGGGGKKGEGKEEEGEGGGGGNNYHITNTQTSTIFITG